MTAQGTECVRVPTALTDNCRSDKGSASCQFDDLSCEMSLMHDSFVHMKVARPPDAWVRRGRQGQKYSAHTQLFCSFP